jgi:A/G-specific adenine glycosylase
MDISKLLELWYKKEARELPWRDSSDPYKIWVSEIILQQTRIAQGIEYYYKFLKKFPSIDILANADISEVLNIWQGLGYYSRARNMHAAAKMIMTNYKGEFPASFDEIIKLKGIGEYTAGAIASIAFNENVPAIDGNVKRVASRLFGIYEDIDKPAGLKKIKQALTEVMQSSHPGRFNEAMMDLGSMICKPLNPDCNSCPLNSVCLAYNNNTVNELPVRYKKIKTRKRYFHYIIITSNNYVLINQRKKKDIWQLLFEFPMIETTGPTEDSQLLDLISEKFLEGFDKMKLHKISRNITHVLSHQKLHARFFHFEIADLKNHTFGEYKIINKEKLNNYPLPRLIEKYLQEQKLI